MSDAELRWTPCGGIVGDYVDLYLPTTDAPRQFHVFCALALMAALVGRRVWVRDGAQQLFCNLFVLLLAPSSLYRKSTCVGIAQELGRKLEGRPDPHQEPARDAQVFLPQQFTPESLLDILKDQPTGLLVIDEFRMFLDALRRDYNSGLREIFMTLYDCRGLHRKIRSQEVRVDDPALSMLTACATGWFTEAVKAGEIRSGFYPRLCMVPAWTKQRHMARGAAPDEDSKRLLLRKLAMLRAAEGEMRLSDVQEQTFGDWVLARQRTIEGSDFEAELASFYTRMERVCLKLAVLLELSTDADSRTISTTSLTDAIALTTWLQDNLRRLFAEEFSWDRQHEQRKKCAQVIQANPGIGRRDLMRKLHVDARTFDGIADTLHQTGEAHLRENRFYPGEAPKDRRRIRDALVGSVPACRRCPPARQLVPSTTEATMSVTSVTGCHRGRCDTFCVGIYWGYRLFSLSVTTSPFRAQNGGNTPL